MYINMAGTGRALGGRNHLGQDKPEIPVRVEGAEPVMAALPYMGVAGTLLAGTAVLPKDQEWAKIAKLVLAAGGAASAIVGVAVALKTKKALQPTGPMAPGAVPSGQQVPDLAPGRLAELLKIDFDREQRETGGTTRSLFVDQEFEATIKNDSNKTLSFYPGIAAFDSGQKLRWRTPALQRQMVTLGPQESRTIGTKARASQAKKPDNEPIFRVPSSAAPWAYNTYSIEVELYRSRDEAKPFMTERIPIVYGYYGWPNA